VGAILISVAKLVITTLCAGIHPSRQLPVVLDCGTDVLPIFPRYDSMRDVLMDLQNEDLLNDDLYLGLRQHRVRGKEYDDFVDKFVTAARKRFPKAFIHLYAPCLAFCLIDCHSIGILTVTVRTLVYRMRGEYSTNSNHRSHVSTTISREPAVSH
jgi:malic enzyme